ncbi:MAG: DUF1565 domain-containing protein [Phycisphaerae bacterium]|nr:DUF1565 domain-containing protein [Phycisphaerae bacterium]
MNAKKTTMVLGVLFVTGLLSSLAAAKDIYVKPGDSTGKGTKDAPYKYLWKAVDKAIRGDVIHVAAGTYEGKNGCGHFTIKTPNLTIAGGYNADFSERNPFKHFTILQRAKDYKGDWMGLPKGIIAGHSRQDHSNMIIDGFVLDARTRNAYKPNGDINPRKSYKGQLVQASSDNIKIRNCVLMNPYGNGIYCTWNGKGNEISNCFVLNTFYTALSTRSAQPDSKILIKNNTVAFVWQQPGKGGGTSLFVGNQGQTEIVNNIFMFNQAFAVNNGFGNDDTVLKGNTFFQCQQGYYKYMDADKKNLLVWKPEELKELDEDAESFMLSEAGGNSDADPKCKPDKDYFDKFSNFVGSKPGKLNMDMMNQWRRSVGLPLQAEQGTARSNWGMAYPLKSVLPNLVSPAKGRGAKPDVTFQKYASKAAAASKKDYAAIEFDSMKSGAAGVQLTKDKPVVFKALIGPPKMTFALKSQGITSDKYICFQLVKPGENPSATRSYVYGYFLKGSEAHKKWQKYAKRAKRYNKKGGLVIKGTASYLGSPSYSYPIGVVVDEVSRK